MSETCWVCLRITPEYVLKNAHKLYDDSTKARTLAKRVSEIIESKYKENPTFFCGRATRTLMASLFYILTASTFTQKDIAKAFDTTQVSIRVNYPRWLKIFPDLSIQKRGTHNWQRIITDDDIEVDECDECGKYRWKHIKQRWYNQRLGKWWEPSFNYSYNGYFPKWIKERLEVRKKDANVK